MTSKEKRKGTYHENWWVNLFRSWKWTARRQPLSGILKDFPSDIEVKTKDMNIICDLLLLKEKNSNAYICFNEKNKKILKLLGIKL